MLFVLWCTPRHISHSTLKSSNCIIHCYSTHACGSSGLRWQWAAQCWDEDLQLFLKQRHFDRCDLRDAMTKCCCMWWNYSCKYLGLMKFYQCAYLPWQEIKSRQMCQFLRMVINIWIIQWIKCELGVNLDEWCLVPWVWEYFIGLDSASSVFASTEDFHNTSQTKRIYSRYYIPQFWSGFFFFQH